MVFKSFGNIRSAILLLIPGLGVSYEIFLPLIKLLKDRFHIIGAQVDGFTLGQNTEFTSIDDQARQVSMNIKENLGGDRACDIGKDSGDGSLIHIISMFSMTNAGRYILLDAVKHFRK
jgi:hypothetical protein